MDACKAEEDTLVVDQSEEMPLDNLTQRGLFSSSETECWKTAEEVLADLQTTDDVEPAAAQDINVSQELAKLEEMTLEDFLMEAGIVRKQKGHTLEDFLTEAVIVRKQKDYTLEDFLIELGIVRREKGYTLDDFVNRARNEKENQSNAGSVVQSPQIKMEGEEASNVGQEKMSVCSTKHCEEGGSHKPGDETDHTPQRISGSTRKGKTAAREIKREEL